MGEGASRPEAVRLGTCMKEAGRQAEEVEEEDGRTEGREEDLVKREEGSCEVEDG